MCVVDRTQTTLLNFSVLAHFRYLFEKLGEFFFLFAMDRESRLSIELSAYRAAKGSDTTVAFGSTCDLRPTCTVLFVNCAYPTLERDALKPQHEYLPPFPAAIYCDIFFHYFWYEP